MCVQRLQQNRRTGEKKRESEQPKGGKGTSESDQPGNAVAKVEGGKGDARGAEAGESSGWRMRTGAPDQLLLEQLIFAQKICCVRERRASK